MRCGIYALWVSLYISINHFIDTAREQLRLAQLETETRESELQLLRAQVNPHFLFNALNTILAVAEEPQRVSETTHALADYLRFSLAQNSELHPLGKELDALENYLPADDDAQYVHIAGAETITGRKTFSGGIAHADEFAAGASLTEHGQYYTGAGWNITAGLLDAPDWNRYLPTGGLHRWYVNGELIGSMTSGAWRTYGSRLVVGAAIQQVIGSLSISSGTVTVNCTNANYNTLSLSENITAWSFTNYPTSYGQTIWIKIVQNASAAKTVAWPASFRWEGGVVPSVSTGLSAVDILAITSVDDGTTWQATLAKGWAA